MIYLNNIVELNTESVNLNIDVNQPITLKWSERGVYQAHLKISNELGDAIVNIHKKGVSRSLSVTLDEEIYDRKAYYIELKLMQNNNVVYKFERKFYSINHRIRESNWVTRLDNPIEKEMNFFKLTPNPVFKKKYIYSSNDKEVFIDICGLGYYTLWINNILVSDAVLNNDVTNYSKIVYYDTYQIDQYLKCGENEIKIELGNGWYNPSPILLLGKYNVRKQLSIGKPCFICDINSGKKHIYSDETWKCTSGQLLQNDIYIGEYFTDIQIDKTNNQVVTIPGPAGKLIPSFIPKVRRTHKISYQSIFKNSEGWIVDFGKIITGQVYLKVKASYTGCIKLLYAENMKENKTLDYQSTISGIYGLEDEESGITYSKPVIQSDIIVKNHEGILHYTNRYTYHSFRYIQIRCNSSDFPIDDLATFEVHTDVERITEFQSSSNKLNTLWEAAIQTRLNNIHSYFADCSRERLGYGGDTVALLYSHLATINPEKLFKKVFIDYVNDQRLDGGITQTAPYVGIMTNGTSNGSGSLGWQLIFPTLAQIIIEEFDDRMFVMKYQNNLSAHIRHLLSFSLNYVCKCCLGDWGSIDEKKSGRIITSPDQEFCSACMYLINLNTYQKLSDELPLLYQYKSKLQQRIVAAREYIYNNFYNNEFNQFGEGTASSWVFATKANLIEEQDGVEKIIQKIDEREGIFPFGIFGMSWVYDYLAKYQKDELILKWLLDNRLESYSQMFKDGNRTLSEHFTSDETFSGSHNHAMFSSYSSWMVKKLLGLNLKDKVLIFNPFHTNLEYIDGSMKTAFGLIKIEILKQKILLTVPKEIDIRAIGVRMIKKQNDDKYTKIIYKWI